MCVLEHQSAAPFFKAHRAFKHFELRKKSVRLDNQSDSDKTKDTNVETADHSNLSSPGYDFVMREAVGVEGITSYVVGYEANEDAHIENENIT